GYLPLRRAYHPRHLVPIDSLLGEQPGVLEAHQFERKAQAAPAYLELAGHSALELPRAAAGVASAIDGVDALVTFKVEPRRPYHLRVGTKQHQLAPALQLEAAAGRKDAIVVPALREFDHLTFSTDKVTVAPPSSHSLV